MNWTGTLCLFCFSTLHVLLLLHCLFFFYFALPPACSIFRQVGMFGMQNYTPPNTKLPATCMTCCLTSAGPKRPYSAFPSLPHYTTTLPFLFLVVSGCFCYFPFPFLCIIRLPFIPFSSCDKTDAFAGHFAFGWGGWRWRGRHKLGQEGRADKTALLRVRDMAQRQRSAFLHGCSGVGIFLGTFSM